CHRTPPLRRTSSRSDTLYGIRSRESAGCADILRPSLEENLEARRNARRPEGVDTKAARCICGEPEEHPECRHEDLTVQGQVQFRGTRDECERSLRLQMLDRD